MVHEVVPYVPSPQLVGAAPGEEPDSSIDFTRELSCGGDFAAPLLNKELRLFLVRDILPFVITTVGLLILTIAFVVQLLAAPDAIPPALFYVSIAQLCCNGAAAALDLVCVISGGKKDRTLAVDLHFVASAIAAAPLCSQITFTPARAVVSCGVGDLGVVNGTATNAKAIAQRQRYCFDYISPWTACFAFSLFVLRRYFPQHGVPVLAALFVGYVLGVVLRPGSTADAPYTVDAGSVISDIAAQASVIVVAAVFCTRFHALGRERFIATVDAERARHLSIEEMRQMDTLLQWALPQTVLQRMVASGVEIRDEVESAAVGVASVTGYASFSQLGVLQAVKALHALFVAADRLLKKHAGIEKIKTAGDCYFVVSGLPEAFNCHASAACRFGGSLMDAAMELAAVPMHGSLGGTEADAENESLRGWTRGALRLRFGVHCGAAFGSVLGTQRLSYEVYGDAYDGALLALRHAAPKQIALTDAVRRRLAIEASLYAADTDSAALFATPDDVAAATEHLDTAGAGATVLFALAPAHASIGTALGEVMARQLARKEHAVSVCTHSVVTGFTGAGSAVGQWTAGRMGEQRGALERRMEAILHLAKARKHRTEKQARYTPATTAAAAANASDVEYPPPALDSAAAVGTEIPQAPDGDAPKLLAVLEDAVNGPFKRGSRVPLVYSFADADEERGYGEWVEHATHELRRDMRFGAMLLFSVVLASYLFTGAAANKSMVSVACFVASFLLGTANAVLTALRTPLRSDVLLANASFFVMAAGVFIGNADQSRSHVITNDVWWIGPFHLLMVDSSALTITPLVRFAVETMIFIGVLLPGLGRSERSHEFPAQAVFALLGVVSLPYMRYLFDKLLRSAFIETRVAALMRQQQDDARRAREVMLLGVVPPHVVKPLQQWLKPTPPADPLAESFAAKVVCHMSLRGFTSTVAEADGPGLSLLDAHRAVDAILDCYPGVSKVGMSGYTVTLVGPLPRRTAPSAERARDDDDSSTRMALSSSEMSAPDVDLATALSAALCVVSALGQVGIVVDAGIDVGSVVGGVVGSRRFSYDVYGRTVQTAQCVAEALHGGSMAGSADIGTDSAVAVALTDAACKLGVASSLAEDHPAATSAGDATFTLPRRQSTLSKTTDRTNASAMEGDDSMLTRVSVSTRLLDVSPAVSARLVTSIDTV